MGYASLKDGTVEIRYVTEAVKKGTLITSVTGSGQISAAEQIEVKAKASGEVVGVVVKNGQEVSTGALLVWLDAGEVERMVRDAEANLESAKLSLEKLKKPADLLSVMQAENALVQAQEGKLKNEDDLKKAYEDGFNATANAFLDFPTAMTGLRETLFASGAPEGGGQLNVDYYASAVYTYDDAVMQYKKRAIDTYQTARIEYDKNFSGYKSASRFSSRTVIESLVQETHETAKNIAEAIKATNDLIQFYKDKLTERNLRSSATADTGLANLNTYTAKTTAHLSTLSASKNIIKTAKDNLVAADRTIAEKTESLAKIKAGADLLDIQSQELTIKQRQNSLADARQKLADYFVRAPFGGIIAKIDIEKGNTLSTNALIATLITKQRTATISLNEIDAAKIKVGQKTTLTFDAIESLSLTGQVAEVDALGAVSQGVVTYNVKIIFDTQDDRVKPGMSVSAAVVTDLKQDVLFVSGNAVKTEGNTTYVELLDQTPRRQPVQVGISNDTIIEIISGLQEGDEVIVRTILPAVQTSTQQAPSLLGTPRGGSFGGGGRLR